MPRGVRHRIKTRALWGPAVEALLTTSYTHLQMPLGHSWGMAVETSAISMENNELFAAACSHSPFPFRPPPPGPPPAKRLPNSCFPNDSVAPQGYRPKAWSYSHKCKRAEHLARSFPFLFNLNMQPTRLSTPLSLAGCAIVQQADKQHSRSP